MNTVSISSTTEVFGINSDNLDLLEFLLQYEISTLHLEQKAVSYTHLEKRNICAFSR